MRMCVNVRRRQQRRRNNSRSTYSRAHDARLLFIYIHVTAIVLLDNDAMLDTIAHNVDKYLPAI